MKISKLEISNLYSFERENISFGRQNVITGINGVGKSNLIRILELITSSISNGFSTCYIEDNQKLEGQKNSWIKLYVYLSPEESRLFVQNIFRTRKRKIDQIIIVIYWEGQRQNQHVHCALIIQNKLIIWKDQQDKFAIITEDMDADVLFRELKNRRNINDKEILKINKDFSCNFDKIFYDNNFCNLLFSHPPKIDQYFRFGRELISNLYRPNNPQGIDSKLINCANLKGNYANADIWFLTAKILCVNLIVVHELRPDINSLKANLNRIKSKEKISAIKGLQHDFSRIFPGYGFEIDSTEDNVNVLIKKIRSKQPGFQIEDSASGYGEVLNMLMMLQRDKTGIIILDEPALHLHPLKQRHFWNFVTRKNKNQVIAVTHSPYLVNLHLFDCKNRLINIQMIDGRSRIFSSDGIKLKTIKAYNFKPEIFFSKCVIFVEGAGEESSLSAISDNLEHLFEKHSIMVASVGGKGNLEDYVKIINAFSLRHVVMTDYDYLCDESKQVKINRKITNASHFIILAQRLEEELNRFDHNVPKIKSFDKNKPCKKIKKPDSISPDWAYYIMNKVMSNNKRLVKKSSLGRIVNLALAEVGVNSDKVWQ